MKYLLWTLLALVVAGGIRHATTEDKIKTAYNKGYVDGVHYTTCTCMVVISYNKDNKNWPSESAKKYCEEKGVFDRAMKNWNEVLEEENKK